MNPGLRLIAGACALALSATCAFAQDAAAVRTAETLRDRALEQNIAYDLVAQITTRFGPRLGGSPSEQAAARWGADYLRGLGLANVSVEQFPLEYWTRGAESVEIVAPFAQPLTVTALGGAAPTPRGGVEAEAVIFAAYRDLLDAAPGSLEGKIAVVLEDTIRAQDGRGYGSSSVMRFQGPTEAAARGAVGYLLRSLGTHDHRFAHTGATRVGEGTIPAFAISPPDAEQLARIVALSDEPVLIRLNAPDIQVRPSHSQNVIAEVVGRERPEEVIVIGGHLDSWDLGSGAIDDAAGVAITTAALKLIADLPQAPRRTIRVVWWGAEEVPQTTGGLAGAQFYADSRADQMDDHVAISESDFGAGAIYALSLPAGADGTFRDAALRVLRPLGVLWDPSPARGGGPDTGPTVARGVPAFRLAQDGTDYFDVHHTADDVIERIDPEQLTQNVAAWAALLWLMADSDIDFRPGMAAAAAD